MQLMRERTWDRISSSLHSEVPHVLRDLCMFSGRPEVTGRSFFLYSWSLPQSSEFSPAGHFFTIITPVGGNPEFLSLLPSRVRPRRVVPPGPSFLGRRQKAESRRQSGKGLDKMTIPLTGSGGLFTTVGRLAGWLANFQAAIGITTPSPGSNWGATGPVIQDLNDNVNNYV